MKLVMDETPYATPVKGENQAARKTRINKDAFLKALFKARGNISHACEIVQLSRPLYYRYQKTDPVFLELAEKIMVDAKEILLDSAEYAYYDEMLNKRIPSLLIFFMKTKGKNRGWVENKETTNDHEDVLDEI